jgi:hypothetical protein
MEKSQTKVKNLLLIGKDELNLCECPFTLLTDKAEEKKKTLEFTDQQNDIIRHWIITGSDRYGLPCAVDEQIYIAMLALSKKKGFNDRTVYFNQYELLKLMKWATSGREYKRLELALSRLSGVTIYADYLWNINEFRGGKFIFHIIDEAFLDKGNKNNQSSYFVWSKTVFDSLINGNIKNLNIEIYFSLSTAISRRFYRLWSKRLYKNDCISFDLQELCHEKLGISRSMIYPSELKRKLEPTLKEHIEKNLLSSAIFRKAKDGRWILTITKYKEDPVPSSAEENLPTIEEEPKTSKGSLITQMVSIGVARKVAINLVDRINIEIVENQVEALPYRKNIDNKAAFLVKAIIENYPLPDNFKKKLVARECERESKLKEEYNCFILDQVDIHLQKCDKAVIEREIEEFKPAFMRHWGLDDISMQNPIWRGMLERDYKFHRKAKTLAIPSFEEWKANIKGLEIKGRSNA